jgi:zinc metalloprotease ZmpA
MADLFGTLVEFYAPNKRYPANYLIGERFRRENDGFDYPRTAIRYMFKPSWDFSSQDCYSQGIGALDPHNSSGVGNRFFYLLAEGAKAPIGFSDISPAQLVCNGNTAMVGIGREVAGNIIYRALSIYLVSTSGYSQYRSATVQAAIDLFGLGSAQHGAVLSACAAVGVN